MDLFWDTFFWTKTPTWMTFNDFLPILGSARGAHRGSNEWCFPVLKTLLGPNGPNTHPRAPQGSPRPQKITPRVPKASKNHPATSIVFGFVWCSDVIRQIIFARDSLPYELCLYTVAIVGCKFVGIAGLGPWRKMLSQNVFATNCPKCIPLDLFDLCCCALLCKLCPKTCLQPTVPILSQWLFVFLLLCFVVWTLSHKTCLQPTVPIVSQ